MSGLNFGVTVMLLLAIAGAVFTYYATKDKKDHKTNTP